MKKIVLLIPSLHRGGAEHVVSRLSFLLSREYDVTVVIFDSKEVDYECGCPIVSVGEAASSDNIFNKILKVIRRIKKYKNIKKQIRPDITYSFGDSANIVNILSGGNDKKITSIRGYGNIRFKTSVVNKLILRPAACFVNRRADKVICVSNVIRNTIIKEYSIDPIKATVIYNGYDFNEIRTKANMESDFEYDSSSFKFISMGSYRDEKGFDILLEAFAKVVIDNSNAILVIMGKGTLKKEKELHNKIIELDISNKVILPGYRNNPYSILSKCECYVLSSRTEGFPNALVEGMICGLPVISTDCKSGPREILCNQYSSNKSTDFIEEEKYGVLVYSFASQEDRQKTVNALAKAMLSMINSQDKLDSYKEAAIKRSYDFSYAVWYEKHVEVFESI